MDKKLSKDAENASSANLTAVDFLIEEIKADALVCVKSIDEWNQVFRQAKEMEKNQIINTFKDAQVFKVMNDETRAEQYYNQLYGK